MIKKLIKDAVIELLNNTSNKNKIGLITKKHEVKLHFVPVKYRVFGGLLQSLNIQFGNFIEVLIHKIVESEKNLEIIPHLSGKKNIKLSLTENTDSIIDKFISNSQNNTDDKLTEKFEKLLNDIIREQKQKVHLIENKHDIDCLFKDKKDKKYYYLEIKYNDDHDTGKFVDINRKFIKTYAGLVKELKINDINDLKPILYYFNYKRMKGNIYVPEKNYISRGSDLFNKFFSIRYEDLDGYLKEVSEDKEIIEIFDNLYKKIRYDE
ncbi:MAG: restriction endonuclease [Patescibacteria group bacterium]|nr:restriction endonuclease [Patescibacteria group bacterium]